MLAKLERARLGGATLLSSRWASARSLYWSACRSAGGTLENSVSSAGADVFGASIGTARSARPYKSSSFTLAVIMLCSSSSSLVVIALFESLGSSVLARAARRRNDGSESLSRVCALALDCTFIAAAGGGGGAARGAGDLAACGGDGGRAGGSRGASSRRCDRNGSGACEINDVLAAERGGMLKPSRRCGARAAGGGGGGGVGGGCAAERVRSGDSL